MARQPYNPDPGLALQRVASEAEWHLGAIERLFRPGAKLTLLVRHDIPGKDCDFVMTTDALPDAIAALQKRHDRDGAPS